MGGRDAVDENQAYLCCALCCVICGVYPTCDSIGASGKVGLCCSNLECCCKAKAPYLVPFGCIGCKFEQDGCSVINGQCQICCLLISCAIPCNDEVPPTLAGFGLTCYPKQGFCMKQGVAIGKMQR